MRWEKEMEFIHTEGTHTGREILNAGEHYFLLLMQAQSQPPQHF